MARTAGRLRRSDVEQMADEHLLRLAATEIKIARGFWDSGMTIRQLERCLDRALIYIEERQMRGEQGKLFG